MGRRALVLAIALLLAAVSAFSIWRWLSGIEGEIRANTEEFVVYRAVVPIAEGTQGAVVLQGGSASYVESKEQKQDLPADYIGSLDQLTQVLQNRVAVGPISQNEILVASQWASANVELTPLVELIDSGLEAVTVSPDIVAGVNGFVRPGDRVNIVVTLNIAFNLTDLATTPEFGIPTETDPNAPEETQETEVPYTRYVLNNVPVIAVGRSVVAKEGAPEEVEVATTVPAADQGTVQGEQVEEIITSVYTLALPAEEVERLIFAQSQGALYFTLVPEDYTLVETKGVTINTLFAGDLVQDIFGS